MPEYLGIPLKVFLTKVSFSFAIDKREEGALHAGEDPRKLLSLTSARP